jgi:hypothetical protein
MIRLEVTKKNYFYDYPKVEQYLRQNKQRLKGLDVKNPIHTVSLLSESDELN